MMTSVAAVRKDPTDAQIVIGFLLFNALFRFALLGINAGEYTDGILLIEQFARRDSFWPPLYTALVWLGRQGGIDPLAAGRGISWIAATLLVLPIWSVARLWGGRKAALYALLLYSVAPMGLRWSLRVMTDSLFVLLFFAACAALMGLGSMPCERRGARIAGATLLAVLATLTRYQGLMLAPLVLLAAGWVAWERLPGRLWAIASQVLWLALPGWLIFQRFAHFEQIAERESPLGLGATLLNYWYLFEMFLFLLPYFLTLPVFVFLMYGLFHGGTEAKARTGFRWLFLYAALAILVTQSAFQSFQSRYLLPLLPFILVCAGAGMDQVEQRLASRGRGGRSLAQGLIGLTLFWSFGFGLVSVSVQRGAFGDLFAAGEYIRSLELPPETPIFTNETYKPGIEGVKLGFVAGRPAELIPEMHGGMVPPGGFRRMPPGSLVAIHSAYAGGLPGIHQMERLLRERFGYDLEPLDGAVFHAWLIPLLPDIMQEPGTHQNPLAWLLRYHRQEFETRLYRVKG